MPARSTTNANTGVALPPQRPDAPPALPTLPTTDRYPELGGYDELLNLYAPRGAGFNGNRTAEGLAAEAWVVGYASSQYDLPINLIARIPPDRSVVVPGFFEGLDLVDTSLMTDSPPQSGGTPAYMRVTDDLTLLEQELEQGGRWLIGAP